MARSNFFRKPKRHRRRFVELREQKVDQLIFAYRRPGLAGGGYHAKTCNGIASCYPCARADDGWERLILNGYFVGPRVRVKCERPSRAREDIPEGLFRTLFDQGVMVSPELMDRALSEGWRIPALD